MSGPAAAVTPPPCWQCGAPFTADAWLDALVDWWAAVNVVRLTCPACSTVEELSLGIDAFERGYVYAAGTAHFAGMEHYPLPGLAIRGFATHLEVTLGGRLRSLPRRDPPKTVSAPAAAEAAPVSSRSGRSTRRRRV